MPQLFKRWIMQSNKRNHYPLDKCGQKIYTSYSTKAKKKNRPAMRACSYCVLVCIGM